MKKIGLSCFLILFFSLTVWSQDQFPIGISGFPHTKLKGPVKTVLTIQQRDERVFETVAESYDQKGRLVESVSSNANIEIHSRTLVRLGGKRFYFYDAQGRLAKTKSYSPQGLYDQSEVFTYDNENRLTGSTFYDSNGKETGKRTYTYFPQKREVLATWNFYYEGRIPRPSKNLLSYDEKNRWTKRTEYDLDGKESGYVTFEYDNNGNFVREVHCCKYIYSHRYEYEFDDRGNWIEKRDIQSQPATEDKPDWMRFYRVITYYSDHDNKPEK